MKSTKSYITLLFFILSAFTANLYAKGNNSDFVLIEKEVQDGLHKKTLYGLAKKVKTNSLLRGLSSVSANTQVEVIPPIYTYIGEAYDDFFALETELHIGLADNKDGKIIFDVIYDKLGEFNEILFLLIKDNKRGLATRDGKIIFDVSYDNITKHNEDLILLSKDNKRGLVSRDGKLLFDTIYKEVLQFNTGFTLIITNFPEKNTVYNALLDKEGKIIVDLNYEARYVQGINAIRHITEGFFEFYKDKSWGLVDELGNIIIDTNETDYTYIVPADFKIRYTQNEAGIRTFILGQPVFYKNANEIPRTVKKINVDAIGYIDNDLFLYFKDKKFGIINRKREVVEAFKYDKMSIVDDTYLLLENSKNKDESFKIKTSYAKDLKFIPRNIEI